MKKALKIVLISLVSLILVVMIAGYVILTHIDLNAYKETITKLVYNATGRQLTFGEAQIKPSFSPTIEIRDASLSNAAWAKQPEMVKVETVDLSFAVLPLLAQKYVISNFVIQNAVINLEESKTNGANWEFTAPVTEESTETTAASWQLINSATAAESDSSLAMLSSVVIKKISLENITINYTDKSNKTESYAIQELDLAENDDDNIDFRFNVNDGLYQGTGMFGAFKKLSSSKGYPVQASVDVMGIKVDADATLFDALSNDLRFEGVVKASGFMGKTSTYNESAEVALNGNLKQIVADIRSISVAGNVITGNVNANLENTVPEIKATLASDKIDLASFESKQKQAAFQLINAAEATTLAPAEVIPYAVLSSVNADAEVNVAKIVSGKSTLVSDLTLLATVQNGTANVKISQGKIGQGTIKADATLRAKNKSLVFKANLNKVNVAEVLKALNAESSSFSIVSGSLTDVVIDLTGTGNTYAALVDSLDGQVIVIMDESKLHIGNMSVLKGNILTQLLNTLKLTKENDDLSLKCAVVRADLKSGKATFPSGIVVNADKFTVVADGTINLNNDKISLSVKPFAGKLTDTNIAKALSSLIKLGGTLQEPSIGVDSANALKTIVGVTTAGPVYLGAQMLLENDGSPCYTALAGTAYESRFPKPENVVNDTTEDVGNLLDTSVGSVKDTTKGLLNLISGKKTDDSSK